MVDNFTKLCATARLLEHVRNESQHSPQGIVDMFRTAGWIMDVTLDGVKVDDGKIVDRRGFKKIRTNLIKNMGGKVGWEIEELVLIPEIEALFSLNAEDDEVARVSCDKELSRFTIDINSPNKREEGTTKFGLRIYMWKEMIRSVSISAFLPRSFLAFNLAFDHDQTGEIALKHPTVQSNLLFTWGKGDINAFPIMKTRRKHDGTGNVFYQQEKLGIYTAALEVFSAVSIPAIHKELSKIFAKMGVQSKTEKN